jgi:hypothetical protein
MEPRIAEEAILPSCGKNRSGAHELRSPVIEQRQGER